MIVINKDDTFGRAKCDGNGATRNQSKILTAGSKYDIIAVPSFDSKFLKNLSTYFIS